MSRFPEGSGESGSPVDPALIIFPFADMLMVRVVVKRFVCVLRLVFLLVGVSVSQPKISVVEGTQFDFGKVDLGETIIKKLTLKNTGNEMLSISNVSTSCGCTVAQLAKRDISPNDTALLTITFYTKDVVGSAVRRQVFVRSNDSTQSKLTITMTARVQRLIEADPRYIIFGVVSPGSAVTRTIGLRNTRDTTVTLLSVSVPDSQFKARLSSHVLKPFGTTKLVVSLEARRTGRLSGEVVISTDNARQRRIGVSCVGLVKKK